MEGANRWLIHNEQQQEKTAFFLGRKLLQTNCELEHLERRVAVTFLDLYDQIIKHYETADLSFTGEVTPELGIALGASVEFGEEHFEPNPVYLLQMKNLRRLKLMER